MFGRGRVLIPDDALPEVLQTSLARHRENLGNMMIALRAVGLDEPAIETHLATLIESYRAELRIAIRGLGGLA